MASPEDALASMIQNLPAKTGKTLEQWVAAVKKTKLAKHGEIVKHLKAEHGIGHGYANLIAQRSLAGDQPAGAEDLVSGQYAGKKEALRPIHDALVKAVKAFGKDVEISPKKTCVSLRRSKQFALIQPSTATRVDVGLNLKGVAPDGRLEASGSFSSMCTHRVRVSNAAEVDRQLLGWLRQAYDAS
jgi:hypothetical protein